MVMVCEKFVLYESWFPSVAIYFFIIFYYYFGGGKCVCVKTGSQS